MRVLVDTNIVLDAVAAREPFRRSAEKIFMLAAKEKIDGYVTANSITDIYYIARTSLSLMEAREMIRHLLRVFVVADIRGEDCEAALDLPMDDFEDALAVVCARNIDADYIVTRDADFLKNGDLFPVITSESLLEKVVE